jgi:SP family general alpha glucoside:H+ symporter-like MFS transporter
VVEHGRTADAEAAVRRLQSSESEHSAYLPTPEETVQLLSQTNEIEKELVAGVSYFDCFRGANLRRTEVCVGTWVTQQMCGPVLMTYVTVFFLQAGLPTAQAFNMSLALVSCLRVN